MATPLDVKNLVRVKGDKVSVYWERESMAGGVLLIPVRNGIPMVAEFIHVAPSDIVRTTEEGKTPGYGGDSPLPKTKAAAE